MKLVQSGRWLGKAGLVVVLTIVMGGVGVGCWGEEKDSVAATAPAGSCPSLSSDVDKLIKSDAELIKLNHFIDITFKTAVSLAVDDSGKKAVQKEQCDWQAKTNECKDAICLKQDLQARFDLLSNLNYESAQYNNNTKLAASCPESAYMDHESDNIICIKRVVSKNNFKVSWRNENDAEMCKRMFRDIATGSDLDFVEPIVRTNDKSDPILKKFSECEVKQKENQLFMGRSFRVFQLPFHDGNTTAIVDWLYQENGGIEIPNDNQSSVTIHTSIFSLYPLSCEIRKYWPMKSGQSEFVNTMIKYHDKYYLLEASFLGINTYPYEDSKQSFGYNKTCFFKPNRDSN